MGSVRKGRRAGGRRPNHSIHASNASRGIFASTVPKYTNRLGDADCGRLPSNDWCRKCDVASYPFCLRNSRGPTPVIFLKARAKPADEEYPSSVETCVIDPCVYRNSSVARRIFSVFARVRKSVPVAWSSRCRVRTLISIDRATSSIMIRPVRTWARTCSVTTPSRLRGAPPGRSRATSSSVTVGPDGRLATVAR